MKFRKGDLVKIKKGYFDKGEDLSGSIGIVLRLKRHEPHFVLYEVMVFGERCFNIRGTARYFDHLDQENLENIEETLNSCLDERLT